MVTFISVTAAAVLGILIGLSLTYIFKHIPEAWLQDYDYDPKAPNFRPAVRMKIVPHGIFAGIFCAAFYVVSVIFFKDLVNKPMPIHIVAIVLIVPVLFLVLISDKLNRIIPDQFWILILAFGFVLLASDYAEGTIWFTEEAKWFAPLINRIGAAIVGGGAIFLIGFIGEMVTSKEAMGQGDMKLLAACGMCTGLYGLIVLIYVSIIVGVVFAIPLLIKKQKRLKEEKEYIENHENPIVAKMELKIKKEEMHFAEDPDYLAFGPFIALGAGVFLALEPVFFKLLLPYMNTFGVYF